MHVYAHVNTHIYTDMSEWLWLHNDLGCSLEADAAAWYEAKERGRREARSPSVTLNWKMLCRDEGLRLYLDGTKVYQPLGT